MIEHTQGLWEVKNRVGGLCIVSQKTDGSKEFITRSCGLENPDEDLANFTLMAVAPELLSLIEESRREHVYDSEATWVCPAADKENWPDGRECECGADEWNAKVDAIIAKAKGNGYFDKDGTLRNADGSRSIFDDVDK